MVVKIVPNDKHNPPGKLADAELHFTDGMLEGLNLLHEPGVVIFYRQQPGKRVYRTLRIPASVALHVHRRMRKV